MNDCCPSKKKSMSDYYYQNDKTSFKMKKKVQPFIRYHVIFLFVSHITYAFMCIMYDYQWNVGFISINQHKHCSVFCEYSATERISFNTRIIRIIRIWWAKKTVSIEFFFSLRTQMFVKQLNHDTFCFSFLKNLISNLTAVEKKSENKSEWERAWK